MTRHAPKLLPALLLLLVPFSWATAPVVHPGKQGPPDTMAARVQGCSTCHGPAGEGTPNGEYPRIAGKPQGYLFNQLRNFRDGRRSYPPMNYLLAYLQDDYLMEMAAFFASQRLAIAAPEASRLPAAQLAKGATLVRTGDAKRGIPACMACHGKALTGINSGIPGLIGLHSRYISTQLQSWRSGTRSANKPDCMRDVAMRLTQDQITSVAAWLALQSAPIQAAPAPPGRWKTPVPCGSQPQ